MRVNAINRLLRGEQGAVHVRIDPSCHELIADLEQVLRDGRKIKKTGRRSDPYFWRTHTSDALSCLLAFDPSAISSAKIAIPPVTETPAEDDNTGVGILNRREDDRFRPDLSTFLTIRCNDKRNKSRRPETRPLAIGNRWQGVSRG